MDDERLKQGKDAFGKDYFRELLERVRSIRASERRIYQQITDIFAECSIDYDKDSQISELFDCNISKDEKILVFNTILKMLSETEAKSTGRKKQYLKMLIYSINDKCNVLKSNLIN